MFSAFFKLHLSVLLAGFTGLFGRLISLDAFLLVYFRIVVAFTCLYLILRVTKKIRKIGSRERTVAMGLGCLMMAQLITFYLAIKVSNVSIGTITVSCICFFTALLEPLVNHHRFSITDIGYSLLTMLGLLLIFHFDTKFRIGIFIGLIASLLSALYTIYNKKYSIGIDLPTMLCWEFAGGLLFLSVLFVPYLFFFGTDGLYFRPSDAFWLLMAGLFCTAFMYLLQIQVLQKLSAFTVMLAYNFEPVYSIILAMIIFNEAKELNFSFYVGISLIVMSVWLQTSKTLYLEKKGKKQKNLNKDA